MNKFDQNHTIALLQLNNFSQKNAFAAMQLSKFNQMRAFAAVQLSAFAVFRTNERLQSSGFTVMKVFALCISAPLTKSRHLQRDFEPQIVFGGVCGGTLRTFNNQPSTLNVQISKLDLRS